jgi:hypothetical protein
VQLRPYEVVVKPGEAVRHRVRLYDAKGHFVREATDATWSLEGLKGTAAGGVFTPAADVPAQGGVVKATVGTLTGTARVRALPPLPWSYDFQDYPGPPPPPFWVNSTGKFQIREHAGTKALMKLTEPLLTRRGRLFIGPVGMSDYTVEADVLASEKRRQMGDAGLIAQRYALVVFGNTQKIELHPWQANATRTRSAPFEWKPETWYRLKLRVQNQPGGSTRVQGKAWPAADPEPEAWAIELLDPMPHRHGAPGLYADAANEVFFDNVKVVPNR